MYLKVVLAARNLSTKTIVRAAPTSIDNLKLSSIGGLHNELYSDLKSAIHFLFSIIDPDVRLLRFILSKLIKYNPTAFPKNFINKILSFQGNFDELMKMLTPVQIKSAHKKRHAYKYELNNPFNSSTQHNTPQPYVSINDLGLNEPDEPLSYEDDNEY